jgi:carbamoyltransferase
MIVLGLNINHGDTSACLIKNGTLIAAVEQERFVRIKHSSDFPFEAIKFCLKAAGIDIDDVNYIAVNSNFKYNFTNKFFFLLKNFYKINFITNRAESILSKKKLKNILEILFKKKIKAKCMFIPHHLAHAFSTLFFLKKNKNSIIFSFDGSGDFSTIESFLISDDKLQLINKNIFPHSLGLFYTAFTQFAGFPKYGDEYKFMGLAGYGKPIYYDLIHKAIINKYPFKLNMDCFNLPKVHYSLNVPQTNKFFSDKFFNFLKSELNLETISYDHQTIKDLASSVQKLFEDCVLINLEDLKKKYNSHRLYLTGGCAFNSLLVAKIIESRMFKEVNVNPNPGDAGGAVGSAFYVCFKENIKIEPEQEIRFTGPSFSKEEIKIEVIDKILIDKNFSVHYIENFEDLCKKAAEIIKLDGLIFWFQDKMEWGPRALGNRSLLADPSKSNISRFLNQTIKRRELFRPFAPVVMEEFADRYFNMYGHLSPNMNIVFQAKQETIEKYKAVVHVDNTSRVQTVSKKNNYKLHTLLKEFYKINECPMLINTSFNVNEPIVMTPTHAFNTFQKTTIKSLVLGNWLIQRNNN